MTFAHAGVGANAEAASDSDPSDEQTLLIPCAAMTDLALPA
jgi:hypothetical protein